MWHSLVLFATGTRKMRTNVNEATARQLYDQYRNDHNIAYVALISEYQGKRFIVDDYHNSRVNRE